VSLAIGLDKDSDIRLAYGRGISRPDPQFLTAATNVDVSTIPPTITFGNPALKAEHANDYDVLYERFLNPVGAIRAGFFYKSITDPIVQLRSGPTHFSPQCTLQFSAVGCFVSQAGNAGHAHITGVEVSFEQHFTYLPGFLKGLGVFANYSYATSQATNVDPGFRNDRPALLRQAPNTWNISPTYDRGRLSLRLGLTYNGPNIFQYAFTSCQNGQTVNADGTCNVNPNDPNNTSPAPTPGGIAGPGGDIYLFAHFQVDAQGSFRLGKGWSFLAEALNLNNEVFGFYQGSQQYFIQREFYKPTYTFGFRWDRAER
jgi:TonB-dependent receptor